MHCLASGIKYIIYCSWAKTIQDVIAIYNYKEDIRET